MRVSGLLVAGFAAMTIVGAVPAVATTMTASELLAQYNVITAGDLYSSQEIEGNAYIGGNLNGNTLQVDFVQGYEPNPALADLVVIGNQNAGVNLSASANSTVVIGGAKNNWINNLGGGSLTVGSLPAETVLDRDTVVRTLSAASGTLAGLASTATMTEGEQGYTFGAGVYNISAAMLAKNEIKLALAAGETAIINVSGLDVSFAKNFVGTSFALASQVVWNFYEATSLNLGAKLIGAVLAPNATVSNFSGSMEGSIFANSIFLTNGEVHQQGFTGTLPMDVEVAAVPLPATLPLMFGALGGLALLRRRRR